jgi:hypothetical protein
MAGGKLEVQIGADKTDFDKKIKEVEFDIKELSKVKLDRLKVGLDTSEINNQIKDAKASLNSLKTTVKDTGQAFASGLTPKVANGGNALMQFSRIAQDAPYGIIGIGNNITATAEAFSYLKQSTGSTGGALKALASSIAGTGGILLGVSLLTTGLTLLAQSGLTVGDVIDKITGNFDEYGATLRNARDEGAKSGAKEVVQMNALIAVAQNEVRSKKDRLNAVEELKKQFPTYYGQLSSEKIMYGDLSKEINTATKALVAKAIGEKLAGKAADAYGEILLANGRYNDKANKLRLFDLETEKKVSEARLASEDIAQKTARARAGQRERLVKGINEESDGIGILTKRYENLLNITSQLYQAPNPSATKTAKTDSTLRAGTSGLDIASTLQTGIKPINIQPIADPIKNLVNTVKLATAEMLIALQEFNDAASAIISDSIASTFANLGSAIGNALATGGNVLKAAGASLLSSLGTVLTEMGKMAIAVGVGLLGIKTALKSLNPAVAIGAGVALIALGSFFSAKSSSIGGGMGGGGGASNSSGSGASNSSFTSSGFSSRGDGGGTVVFEIAGQKLIGVLSNTINANKRLGGAIGL